MSGTNPQPMDAASNPVTARVWYTDPSGLFLTKAATPARAERGDLVTWTVTVKNNRNTAARNVRVEDMLPPGFLYVPGSSRKGQEQLPDPKGGPGRKLVFDLGEVHSASESTFSYVSSIGTSAGTGRRINRATAQGETGEFLRLLSGTAHAEVLVEPSRVFREEGTVIGKVFLDCNTDGMQHSDAAEPGIPGVRIVFEDGTSVVTDLFGRYSIYGLRAVTHVARPDPLTLPGGLRILPTGNREAFDARSQFVDLHKGELHRTDFALGPCDDAIRDTVAARRATFDGRPDPASLLDRKFDTGNGTSSRHGMARGTVSADGIVSADDAASADETIPSVPESPTTTAHPVWQKHIPPLRNLEQEIRSFDSSLEFIELADGDSLARRIIPVRVKGRAGGQVALFVNGEAVSMSRIGQTVVWEDGETAAWEFVAVVLSPGTNMLELRMLDGFGIERERKQITIQAPGPAVRLEINAPNDAPADGRSAVPVVVRLIDAGGLLSPDQAVVTLETKVGRFDIADMEPENPGVQTLIDNGEALFDLIPPEVAGSQTFTIKTSFGNFSKRITFSPDLRPMIVVGILEGALRLGGNSQDIGHLLDDSELSPFEKTVQGVNGKLYLKGRIRGDRLLTLAYDSDKDTRARMFRDLQPYEFYPVYGDWSVKKFDAQSSGKLYVRVEKGSSYVLYGDFSTSENQSGLKLGNWSRNMTGGKLHLERDAVTVTAFAARVDHHQRVLEIPASGISGPYDVPVDEEIVPNSEQVDIVTRDRTRHGFIIRTQSLTRFVDYTLSYFDSTILFSKPVPAFDDDLNPQFIRMIVELHGTVAMHWVYGGNMRLRIADGSVAGVSAIKSEESGNHLALQSAWIEVEVGKHGKLVAEVAHSESETSGSGWGGRAEFGWTSENLEVTLNAAQTEESFESPDAYIPAGQREVRAEVKTKLTEKAWFKVEGSRSEGHEPDESRTDVSMAVDYAVSDSLLLGAGVRHTQKKTITEVKSTSIFAGIDWKPKTLPKLSFRVEYEQDIDESDNRRLSIGAERAFEKGKIYARHEFISAVPGSFWLERTNGGETTVVGAEYSNAGNLHSFSEYRVRQTERGPSESEIASGIRGAWEVGGGLNARMRLERIMRIGAAGESGTSVSTSVGYEPPEGKWAGRVSVDWSERKNTQTWYGRIDTAYRLNPGWTALLQNRIAVSNTKDGKGRRENRLRAGLAWRPVDGNQFDVLGWYELVRKTGMEKDGASGHTHLWALTANWRATPRLVLTGGYAGKRAKPTVPAVSDTRLLHQLSARLTYDLSDKFDIGIAASTLFEGYFRNPVRQFGVESGYLLDNNAWLSLGYNTIGYDEEDLGNGHAKGPYIRLRVKFDESMFTWLQ